MISRMSSVKKWGYGRADSKAILKTRLASMDAEERKRAFTDDNVIDTSVPVTSKRGRTLADAAEHLGGAPHPTRAAEHLAARMLFAWPSLRTRK